MPWLIFHKERYLSLCSLYCVWRDDFQKKISSFNFFFTLIFYHFIFCSINLKRQSEHSRPRPDTSSLVQFKKRVNKILNKASSQDFEKSFFLNKASSLHKRACDFAIIRSSLHFREPVSFNRARRFFVNISSDKSVRVRFSFLHLKNFQPPSQKV